MFDTDLLSTIPDFNEMKIIKQFQKGWSPDKKYYTEDETGQQFQIHLSLPKQFQNKKFEFDSMLKLHHLGVRLPIPIKFGWCGHKKAVYSIFEWLPGDDAEETILTFSKNKQYQLGKRGGKILQTIHSTFHDELQNHNNYDYSSIIYQKIKEYHHSNVTIEKEKQILDFLYTNLRYVQNRPRTFRHGDYNMGNLIITPDQEIGIIDFGQSCYGDPWDDFNRMIYSWQRSIPFAIGQIHGYFNNQIPELFFTIMAIYTARSILGSILWAKPFGIETLNRMKNQGKKIIQSYNNFDTIIPSWYKSPENMN